MYQFALVQMLHNQKEDKWHPIFYYDNPLPGGFEDGSLNSKMMRYKSKGHHTTGFKLREDAVKSAHELEQQLISHNDTVTMSIDTDIEWDGLDIPADSVLWPLHPNLTK